MAINLFSDQVKIEDQVNRIITSPRFQNSAILSDFLKFIVSETLSGRGEQLKEYVIALHVLKKKTDFNPQLSAIVRIHARRLRGLIEDYYRVIGGSDPVVISIPKGRYVPVFEINNVPQAKQSTVNGINQKKTGSKPIIAILPLKNLNGNQWIDVIASSFCQDLSVEFTRFNEIGVISNYSSRAVAEKTDDLQEIGQHLGADYLITGSCILREKIAKISLELNSIEKNQLLWAETYFIENITYAKLTAYDSIIRKVVSATCGYFGFIYRDSLNKYIPTDFSYLYAVYLYNRFNQTFSEESLRETLKAVEQGLENDPENAELWALKGKLYLNYGFFDFDAGTDYIKLGIHCAQQALNIDPNSQFAYMDLGWANLLIHDKKEFLRNVNKLISINPNSVMYSGNAGFGFICAGEYEEGVKYMLDAIRLNPYYPWYLNVGFCLYYLSKKEYKEALFWAERVNRPGFYWDHLIKASIQGLLGNSGEAGEEVARLLEIIPGFEERAKHIVGFFLLDEQLRHSIIRGLILAGMSIPE
jgi:TolB-like protein